MALKTIHRYNTDIGVGLLFSHPSTIYFANRHWIPERHLLLLGSLLKILLCSHKVGWISRCFQKCITTTDKENLIGYEEDSQ